MNLSAPLFYQRIITLQHVSSLQTCTDSSVTFYIFDSNLFLQSQSDEIAYTLFSSTRVRCRHLIKLATEVLIMLHVSFPNVTVLLQYSVQRYGSTEYSVHSTVFKWTLLSYSIWSTSLHFHPGRYIPVQCNGAKAT